MCSYKKDKDFSIAFFLMWIVITLCFEIFYWIHLYNEATEWERTSKRCIDNWGIPIKDFYTTWNPYMFDCQTKEQGSNKIHILGL